MFKHYNPDFTLVESKSVGGQLNFEFALRTVFLFDDEYTKNLLEELDMKYNVVDMKIRYFSNGKLKKDVSEKENKIYNAKKIVHAKLPIEKIVKFSKVVPRSSMECKYINTNMIELLEKLSKSIEIVNKKAILIDTANKTVTFEDYKKFDYEKLVSTIPAPDFRYIAYNSNIKNQFRYLPGTFVVSSELPLSMREYSDSFELLYYCNDDMIFNRVWKNADKYLYEIPGDLSELECRNFFDEMKVNIEKHFVRRINFIFSEKTKKIKDVMFLGRLACWNADEFISDSIRRAAEFKREGDNA